MPKFQWQSDFGTLIKLQGNEGELEGNGVEEVEDNVLVRVQVGPYPDLRDTALDLVLLRLELGSKRLEVFPVEQELLVLGFGLLHGLEEIDDFLELWWGLFYGLQR